MKKEEEIIRKNIDIPKNILVDLKVMAAKENKDLKNFIQDLLKGLVVKGKSLKEKVK